MLLQPDVSLLMIEMQTGPVRFDDEPNDYNTVSTNSQDKVGVHTTDGPEPNFSVHRYGGSTNEVFQVALLVSSASEASNPRITARSYSKCHRIVVTIESRRCSKLFREGCKHDNEYRGFTVRMDHQRKLLAEKTYTSGRFASLLCCCFGEKQSTMVALEITTEALRQKKFVTLRLLQGVSRCLV